MLDHLVVDGSEEIDKTIFLTCRLNAADYSMTFFPFMYQYRDHLNRILKVCTYRDDTVTIK